MSIDQPSDNEQKETSLNGATLDNAAFESFFKNNFTALCAFCQYKFGFDLDVAKEAVHTAFIKLWETRNTLTPGVSIKAYLYKIIINTSLDILKHQKVKQKHEEHVLRTTSESVTNGFEKVDSKQLAEDINEALASLPQQMRLIFELSRYEGLKYAEIAQQLNISIKTVETQMSRALAKLRQKLGHYLIILLMVLISILIK